LVGVEVNNDYCLPLHAHNGDEKRKFIKNKVSNDGDSFDDDDIEFIKGKEGVIKIGGITTTSENEFIMDDVGGSNEYSSSNVLVEKAIISLSHTTQKITKECNKEG
jgi:hypothetical protein